MTQVIRCADKAPSARGPFTLESLLDALEFLQARLDLLLRYFHLAHYLFATSHSLAIPWLQIP